MKWDVISIRKKIGGKLIGKPFMETIVCKTILLLPDDLIEKVCSSVWFIASQEDAWALTFRGSELKERHLIFLSDALLAQSDDQITYTILHEIGHVLLNHRNSIGALQTESEIQQQEAAADAFATNYLDFEP